MTLMSRPFATLAALMLSSVALAAEPVMLTVGDPAARHATIAFSPDRSGPDAILITASRVGAPGSRLSLRIDRSGTPLYERLLSEKDCTFTDTGSACMLRIVGGTSQYYAIVTAFKRGLTLHVEIQNAGSMEMQQDVTLRGFTRAYNAL